MEDRRGVIILDNGTTVIRHVAARPRRRDRLVVTFAQLGLNDPSRPGFAEGFFVNRGYDGIFVQKRADCWYQDLDVGAFRDAVAPIAAEYARCWFYGISMGAFAALYFGGCVDGSVIALSPLCSIHPGLAGAAALSARLGVAATRCDMAAAPKGGGEVFIAYDPRQALDRAYMAAEILPAFPAARIGLAPGAGHPVSQALNEMGLLGGALLGLVEGGTMPDFATTMRPARRRSPVWLELLGDRCAGSGRPDAALALYAQAERLAPQPERLARKRERFLRALAPPRG